MWLVAPTFSFPTHRLSDSPCQFSNTAAITFFCGAFFSYVFFSPRSTFQSISAQHNTVRSSHPHHASRRPMPIKLSFLKAGSVNAVSYASWSTFAFTDFFFLPIWRSTWFWFTRSVCRTRGWRNLNRVTFRQNVESFLNEFPETFLSDAEASTTCACQKSVCYSVPSLVLSLCRRAGLRF